ncbi:hypothetical protein LRP52_29230 [Photobacterium sp. ZSDE20]|uniref:TrbC family F-type conjugative pilus assembly protein n=1 Tax=Photobacterium pectinilyticum TaxID=2906793 RepID=A0ABT1N6B2_9GAMM|nr:TrbC family F-type conjugative pilus assembly protein [Photobacterium sp. ZSDE20]MCQ1060276.1 TrbC family F-type conjugative pilus assembly protein [Photobacterium sp. ZSDE20]MDD1826263.1 hypothetical protein [Photobacterium sp. ZSDE20]
MQYYKKSIMTMAASLLLPIASHANQMSQAEREAFGAVHSQFENIDTTGKSSYQASQQWLDGLMVEPRKMNDQYPVDAVFNREDIKLFTQRERVNQQIRQEEAKPEWAQPVNSHFTDLSQDIASDSLNKVENRIRELYPENQDAVTVASGNAGTGLLNQNENLYYFISTSLPKASLEQILYSVSHSGGTAVIRGFLPNTSHLRETMVYLKSIIDGMDVEQAPNIILDPRLFAVFGIQNAPAMVYTRDDVQVIAKGAATPEWMIEKGRDAGKSEDLGVISDLYEIVERDLIELMEERYAQIDWKKQQEQAISRFFARQTFPTFPVSETTKVFEVDPRVVFVKDVHTGNGEQLASKGDVVNPLQGFEGNNISLFVIDPRDDRQKTLVKERLYADAKGRPHVIVSHLDKDKKFDGIGDLQNELKTQIFMMQPNYVERFRIEHLPARIDIIGGRGMWMTEYGNDYLDELHSDYIHSQG